MKVLVIGSPISGHIIKGKTKMGERVVVRHLGKVEHGVIIRTKRYTKTKVRFDGVVVMLDNLMSRVKGPISKGLDSKVTSLASTKI